MGPGPRGTEFSDPLSPAVEAWIRELSKAAKGMRVYAENNEMLKKYLDTAYAGLEKLLAEVPELHLSIREDRILYGKDAVYVNADREEGLPFTFYRNAFRRITLVRGMRRDELARLLKAITTDYKGYNSMGEDLVTTLWREALPHLRYLTIDSITSGKKGVTTDLDREELERIQGNIEGIVAAIYQTTAEDDDIVAGVSITKEDLEALKDIRAETEEDLDMLDHATSRAIAKIAKRDLDAVHEALDDDTRDHLTSEMLDILVRMLFKETSSKESASTIDLLQRLFDSLVLGQDYRHAIALIEHLRDVAADSNNMQEVHIARHLLRLFAAESRVLPVLNALNDGYTSASVTDMVAFLRALGAPIANALIGNLEMVTSPTHRRLLCDLIVEFGVPDVARLMNICESAKWFVVRDVLGLAQHHPPEKISVLIKQALAHEHPKVRAYAVGMLRGYARGLADQLIVDRIHDEDLDVRLSAIRVAAARRSAPAREALHRMISAEDLLDREPRELRMAMAAYATIARAEAVPLLDSILNPGFLKTLKNTEPQVAAAFALASLGPAGAEALAKGARSLNSKVRDACKRALVREGKKDGTVDLAAIPKTPTDPTGDLPDPNARTAITGIPSAKTDPTQPKEAEDPTPSQTMMSVDADSLEDAPPFYLYDPTLDAEAANVPAHRPLYEQGPNVSAVMQPYPTPDLIPTNLPPAPRAPVEVGRTHVELGFAGMRDATSQDIEAATQSYGDAPPPSRPPPKSEGAPPRMPPTNENAPPRMPPTNENAPPYRGAASNENAPPSAAGTRDVLPAFRGPPPTNENSPPSAAGTRDVLPPFRGPPPPSDYAPPSRPPMPSAFVDDAPTFDSEDETHGEVRGDFAFPGLEAPPLPERDAPTFEDESGDIPDWVSEAMRSVSSEEELDEEMTLEIGELSDRRAAAPTPPSPAAEPDAMALPIGELADRRLDPIASGSTSDDIPSADDVVASLFADVSEPATEGETPLEADEVTGDITTTSEPDANASPPTSIERDPIPDPMSAPYIPTVDSDPFGTPSGAPPPRSSTWSGGPPKEPAPPPVLPWVDDLVLDSDVKSGGTEDD